MNDMEGNKTYSLPKGFVMETIYDIIELQNGKLILSDAIHGRIHYHISMYGNTWELMYTVVGMAKNKSNVTISVCGERHDKEKELRRQFALLDSFLTQGDGSVVLKRNRTVPLRGNREKWDREIKAELSHQKK